MSDDMEAYDIPLALVPRATRLYCAAMAELGVSIVPTGDGREVFCEEEPPLDLHFRAVNLVQASLGLPTFRDLEHLDAWCDWKQARNGERA